MKYLPVDVYAVSSDDTFVRGDCTANGITVTHKGALVVPCEEGYITEEDVKEQGFIKLELGIINDTTHFKKEGETRWAMFGGNFVYTSDSRFGRKYGRRPVHVHDRIE